MNLELIKPQTFGIKIGKQIYELKYTLKAFAFIEEQLGSVNDGIKAFNEKNFKAIAVMFFAGLIHTGKNYDVMRLMKNADPAELACVISSAINEVISSDYSFDKEFDWSLLYFIAKPALNFSEEEFWQSTPKKILMMMKMLEELKIGKTKEILTENKAAEAFMSW